MNSTRALRLTLLPSFQKTLLLGSLALLLHACSQHTGNQQKDQRSLLSQEESLAILEKFYQDSSTQQLTGAQLARVYCGVCHQFPDPSLLDKPSWMHKVLPNMGARMGVRMPARYAAQADNTMYPSGLSSPSGYANYSIITEENWEKIIAYYNSLAPEEPLPQEPKMAVSTELPLFKLQLPHNSSHLPPLITLLRYNPLDSLLYVGNRHSMLYSLEGQPLEGQPLEGQPLRVQDSLQTPSPPADILFREDGSFYLLSMGIMDPSDAAMGRLDLLRMDMQEPTSAPLLNTLFRPVQLASVDLDLDGQEDLVVSEFGFNSGRLSWHKKTPTGYKSHTINQLPGARRVIVQDMNGDGRPDLVVLMTQAREGVYVYYNKEAGFQEKALLQFPPVYGISDFSLVDIDQDGDLDILCAFGDNADYSYSLKHYHGLRLFLQDTQGVFTERWFYPMHGATRAIAEDFDQDGDLDIAAIAFFPDFKEAPLESFIYFEHTGKLNFSPRTLDTTPYGRWLTLESGDVDQDGDQDLILGSFLLGPAVGAEALLAQWQKAGVPYLVLKNQLRGPAAPSAASTGVR